MAKAEQSTFALEPPQMTILSDHHAESTADDYLSLESRLSVVLDILRHRQTRCPITVAIYGDWGTGKTSAMHWLETQLDAWNKQDSRERTTKIDGKDVIHPRVYSVWFDPWKYHSREEVWRGIIAEVILSLFRNCASPVRRVLGVRRRSPRSRRFVRCWVFGVRCWMLGPRRFACGSTAL